MNQKGGATYLQPAPLRLTSRSPASQAQRLCLLTAHNDADLKGYFALFPLPSTIILPSGCRPLPAACMKRKSNGRLLATPVAALIRLICPIGCTRDVCMNVGKIQARVMFSFAQSASGLIRQFVRK